MKYETPSLVLALLALPVCVLANQREKTRLDQDWLFSLEGAAEQRVSLPHDWSATGRVSILENSGNNGGYYPNGKGRYRRTLEIPRDWTGRRLTLRLEGSYMNTRVLLDGRELASQPYGYTPMVVDLGELPAGSSHALEVTVDNSEQPNSRWYSGSGLYRHVWLEATPLFRIAENGVVVQTLSLTDAAAELSISTETENLGKESIRQVLRQRLLDAKGELVASSESTLEALPGWKVPVKQTLRLPLPKAWSPEQPYLYRLVSELLEGDKVLDCLETPVGLRTLRVSAAGGLELNGKPLLLNGGNLHHDNGALGAAAFDRAEERKVELMKAAGFNAVRTSHNPPSSAFLAACDRLGLLVMDEAFDGWVKKKTPNDYGKHFKEWWRRDLESMVRRDRNHPSVILWSIGNEVYERGTPEGHRIARELAACIRELDSTRPITAGINDVPGKWAEALDPLFASLDIAGYNYETAKALSDKERVPERVIVLTESYQNEAALNAKVCAEHSHIIGDFVWTAIDYLGEAGIGRAHPSGQSPTAHWEADQWPWHGAYCGDIDLTGWRKPASHWRAISWNAGESLYASVRIPSPNGKDWELTKWAMPPSLPVWNWPGQEGKTLKMDIFSRHPRVRVTLDGLEVAQAPCGVEHGYSAVVEIICKAGVLCVEGLDTEGKVVESHTLPSPSPASVLGLTADRTELKADGQDLSFVTVELLDTEGRWNPFTDVPVSYSVEGPATLAGIANGDMTSQESFVDNPRRSWQGRSLVILRSTGEAGEVVLKANAPGMKPCEIRLQAR